ncbi:hypothetical protein CJ030_MR2G018641 [Morella rubra]|uniref:Protein kinase domain-containing protein n=1 Tax=Morella rubra TaxID=262757 RepID=A0A6A1WDB3_9ROSI|nr:hypothetical protein CJ030_MR2G018641 [Morella rubra]
MDFDFNSFNGEISSSLGLLPRLQILSLRGNSFTGTIPTSLCNISSLRQIYLGFNSLTGFIPASIFNLSSLQIISLRDNKLSGPMPHVFFDMPSLQIFGLHMNKLSGGLPVDMFRHLPNLQKFDVSSNQFYGKLPSTLFKCKQLNYLRLSRNNFEGTLPPEIGNLTMLRNLSLQYNNFEGVIPNQIGNLRNLEEFAIDNNNFISSIPYEIFKISSLQVISMPMNNLSGQLPSNVGLFLPNLQILYLAMNELRGTIPNSISNASQLTGLDLAFNSFSGFIPKTIEGAFRSFDAECEVFRNIRHRNVVKFISACSNMDFKAFVLEYMPNGNLEMWLYSDSRFLNLLQRLNIMIDVAAALEYLHFGNATPIVHCDLKPSNVLLDEDMVAHVADFGIAKLLGDGDSMTQTMTLATIGYMAPEYGLEGIVSTRGDVYSYGILLMETFTRKRPTDNLPEKRINMANVLVGLHKVKLKFLRDIEGGNVRVSTN